MSGPGLFDSKPEPRPPEDGPAPGPWTFKEFGRLLDDSGPACFRITAADGTRVCDVAVHPSINGPGVATARRNAQWIVDHGPTGERR